MQDPNHEIKEIIEAVRLAFADTTDSGKGDIVINLNHYEADEIIEDFRGKHWTEVTVEIAYWHRISLPQFTPEAFRYFIPGFLVAALETPFGSGYNSAEILDHVFFNLVPSNDDHDKSSLIERINGFTSTQRAALAKFLYYVIEHNPFYEKFYGDSVRALWDE